MYLHLGISSGPANRLLSPYLAGVPGRGLRSVRTPERSVGRAAVMLWVKVERPRILLPAATGGPSTPRTQPHSSSSSPAITTYGGTYN